jgi:uncharacterized protein YciW
MPSISAIVVGGFYHCFAAQRRDLSRGLKSKQFVNQSRLSLSVNYLSTLDEERFMRYYHAALSPVSVEERRHSQARGVPVRRISAPRRLAWKIVYSSFIAGVAIYVWWRR